VREEQKKKKKKDTVCKINLKREDSKFKCVIDWLLRNACGEKNIREVVRFGKINERGGGEELLFLALLLKEKKGFQAKSEDLRKRIGKDGEGEGEGGDFRSFGCQGVGS